MSTIDVVTPYGEGSLVNVRPDGIIEVRLRNANGHYYSGFFHMSSCRQKPSQRPAPAAGAPAFPLCGMADMMEMDGSAPFAERGNKRLLSEEAFPHAASQKHAKGLPVTPACGFPYSR